MDTAYPGALTWSSDPMGQTWWLYAGHPDFGNLGHPTEVQRWWNTGEAVTFNHEYNLLGAVTETSWPSGTTVTTDYLMGVAQQHTVPSTATPSSSPPSGMPLATTTASPVPLDTSSSLSGSRLRSSPAPPGL